MNANPFLGVFLHAVGGFAAASFYIPFKKVKGWSWETYWLVGGFFSWIIAPWVVSLIVCPDLFGIFAATPLNTKLWCYFFGMLWGIGGLTFGLSMRYLGMSLGYALALGFCAAFGTIVPAVAHGEILKIASVHSGQVTLAGVAVCMFGIATCGKAGVLKESEVSEEAKKATIQEFDFKKGLWVAIFAGLLSACMAFGIDAGKPMADLARIHHTPDLFVNSPVFIFIFAGGFTTNVIWCLFLSMKNGTAKDYVNAHGGSLPINYIFSALAGITWYCQFMFYGMGSTQMGKYGFSSWTLHMAFIIVFSNLWGLSFKEWKGSSKRTLSFVYSGLIILVLSTVVVGIGNYIGVAK